MKVNINTTPLKTGHAVRGIGVYTKNLIAALKNIKDVEIVDSDADIVHYPYFDLFFHTLKINKEEIAIVTIHDVIPLLYPKNYPSGIKGKINFLRQKRELNKVGAILTDSETSKKDIVRLLNVPASKIYVTRLAAGKMFRKLKPGNWQKTIRKKYKLPSEFVLYVGDVNYNKNLLALAKACEKLDLTLIIVGKQAVSDFDKNHVENKALSDLIEKYGSNPKILRIGFIDDEDLVAIYNLASVYCQPSLYEGFGLPVLEAMACGVPVACSKTQALVELADKAATYFDPYDVDDIAKKISNLLSDKNLQKELIRKGDECIKKYDWSKTAKATYLVYKHVLQK